MRQKVIFTGIVILTVLIYINCTRQSDFPVLKGPYFGQDPPGMKPEIFASGIVSTGLEEHYSPVFTPDGLSLYYTINVSLEPRPIFYMKYESNIWSFPESLPFSGKYSDGHPFVSPDGKTLFFYSMRPLAEGAEPNDNSDIWIVDITQDGWSDPRNMGSPINTPGNESGPSATDDDTLYFIRDGNLMYSRCINGFYQKPENISSLFSSEYWNGFYSISKDGSFILFGSNRPGGYGSVDLYVLFREDEEKWSGPINLGETVNSSRWEGSPKVSNDGKYLFFCSNRINNKSRFSEKRLLYKDVIKRNTAAGNGSGDIYWVDSKIVEDLKLKELR